MGLSVSRKNTQQTKRDAQDKDWYSDQGQQIPGGTSLVTLTLICTDNLNDLASGTVTIVLYPFIDIIDRKTGHEESHDTDRTEYDPQCSCKYLDDRWPSL